MDNASESLCNDDLGHCANTNESLHVALNCYKFFNDRIECLVNRSLNHLKFEGVSVSVFCECVPLTTFTCMLYSTQYTYPFIYTCKLQYLVAHNVNSIISCLTIIVIIILWNKSDIPLTVGKVTAHECNKQFVTFVICYNLLSFAEIYYTTVWKKVLGWNSQNYC